MKAAGIVVEYNPFHNGHLLHVNETKKVTGADIVIAVMSGPFLQRGEPALVSKWARTKMALASGVDIVIELPFCFAVQHATHFASGAVRLLDAIGCDTLCFGSEDGTVAPFINMVAWKNNNEQLLNEKIKQLSKDGLSYPTATAKSYDLLADNQGSALDLSQPNNMLGFQYIEAIHKYAPGITPFTIKRQASGYHQAELHQEKISSATSIRKAIYEDGITSVSGHVPPETYSGLLQYYNHVKQYHSWEDYWALLQYSILSQSPEELRTYYEMEEGIEYRLIDAARKADSFTSFMEAVKTKRYTWTRLQRIFTHLINHTKKEDFSGNTAPAYLRLLGMSQPGRSYLQRRKKEFGLPLISRVGRNDEQLLSMDLKAGRVYAMGVTNKAARSSLLLADYTNPPIIQL
ncbi:nucleotidyltransferase [Jeotgalibacillus proteolyticus]|uniref:nucleotidyltransferase n=1 Tax=Jeotgalibacillus proteolyticus TaxID=2082395 RepID=UPI00142F83FB|nr:nucleotidyltransferase [Jeotgalibacillus proteolyticus]